MSGRKNSTENTQKPESYRITVFRVRTGQVPGFKNRKLLGKNGLYTDPKIKARMDEIIQALRSSACESVIIDGETWMELKVRCLTALCEPGPLPMTTWESFLEELTDIQKSKKGRKDSI